MTYRDEISKDVDDLLAGWFDGERYDVDKNDIVELVLKHSAQAAAPSVAVTPAKAKCKNCGGNLNSWFTSNRVNSIAVDGRLKSSEISCDFVLGCDECSETLQVVPADEIASQMNAALSTQVQDVAGMLDETWNAAVEQAAAIANDCVHLTPDPGTAIRTMLNGRTKLHPAARAKQEERILHKHTNIRSGD